MDAPIRCANQWVPVPPLVKRALKGRDHLLANGSHRDPDRLDDRAVAVVLAQMKEEWIQSAGDAAGTNAAARKQAWQKHLHTTAPHNERAIRFVIAGGLQMLPYFWKPCAHWLRDVEEGPEPSKR